MRHRTLAFAAIALCTALAEGCDGGCTGGCPPRPTPEVEASVVLTATPNTDDGMMLLTVSGATIDSARGASLITRHDGATEHWYLVRGSLRRGDNLLKLYLPGGSDISRIRSVVTEVAANSRGGYALRDTSGYVVTPQ